MVWRSACQCEWRNLSQCRSACCVLIRRTKDNELIFTIVPFADARRFNAEGTFARALSKTWEGQTYTLTPASHLWIMPFPAGAVQNPGNGTITQNVSK